MFFFFAFHVYPITVIDGRNKNVKKDVSAVVRVWCALGFLFLFFYRLSTRQSQLFVV